MVRVEKLQLQRKCKSNCKCWRRTRRRRRTIKRTIDRPLSGIAWQSNSYSTTHSSSTSSSSTTRTSFTNYWISCSLTIISYEFIGRIVRHCIERRRSRRRRCRWTISGRINPETMSRGGGEGEEVLTMSQVQTFIVNKCFYNPRFIFPFFFFFLFCISSETSFLLFIQHQFNYCAGGIKTLPLAAIFI